MDILQYFCRYDCPYYPCHDLLEINCCFCYCPLYSLTDCGGAFTILKNGLKDCSKCLLPHIIDNFEYILTRYLNDVSPQSSGPK
ncbi:MAG TPA: cysteine-rich small domain-containing protein [Syntrophomonadaceae bacterium]|nr:cysteine-rich small domain-containing protein [Syntrophomonadaceae bacterium]